VFFDGDFSTIVQEIQQYYDVWNTDGTLNKDGYKDFLDDAKEGIEITSIPSYQLLVQYVL
jgi:hypothetical protein